MMKVILVDDEDACLASLEEKLKLLDEEVRVIKICSNGKEAIAAIEALNPDAVFLDISMPQMDAFTMLQELEPINFELIFTTAHDEYAVKAIRLSAFDFLLKPINLEELRDCVQRLKEKLNVQKIQAQKQQQVNNFIQLFRNPAPAEPRIALPTMTGLLFIPIKEIIRAQSESNYTIFYLVGGKKELVSKTMKEFEELLCSYNFFRVHKSHIVNLSFVSQYVKADGGSLVLSDGTSVEVSVRKKAELLERLVDKR